MWVDNMDMEIEVNREHIRRPNQSVLKMCIKDCAKDVFPAILPYHLMTEEPLNIFFSVLMIRLKTCHIKPH